MRAGRNPTKTTELGAHSVDPPPPISVALLTHVPYLAGFHADQLDVIRLAVLSARHHAGRPVHLVVVDNGSCQEVVDWLTGALERGDIDQLVRNRRNLGKVTALSQALLGSPGPDVVFADGDLRFTPGWLDALLEIRDAFPTAGLIGGRPLAFEIQQEPVPAPPGGTATQGRFIATETLREQLTDTGVTGGELETRLAGMAEIEQTLLERDGVQALAGAYHCQFLLTAAARARLQPLVGSEALSATEDESFDAAVDALGLLRLSTTGSHYRHVGNRMSDDDRAELARLGEQATSRAARPLHSPNWRRFAIRRLAFHVHNITFRILYDS
ncbi:MAG: hypothetical protein JWO77_1066 [Ilumatobacteraceae bacterium]|nr:hypothetical protein [Ilumatobacteraceae bacterium]